MKITHVLGHNSNWNIEAYFEQQIGDYFLIAAFNHGTDFYSKNIFQKIKDKAMVDLQFYGKKKKVGKLSEYQFHPSNCKTKEETNVYFENCVKQSIKFQQEKGFKNIIIPHFYENEEVQDIIDTLKIFNKYIPTIKRNGEKYFMTLPFANHVIINNEKVEEILFETTNQKIIFDGYFIVCENRPEFRKKVTTDIKVLRNLSKVLKTLKQQEFEIIYAYANWDAIIFLAQTDIDYLTIGTYENMRNFDIKRFTEVEAGGGSKGYYFSEKLLNMVKADNVTLIRDTGNLELIRNERNIFSDIILREGYPWNIHKPDVNKNYLLSISRILANISNISDIKNRKDYVLKMLDNAITCYQELDDNKIFLDYESTNYHLNIWKTYLSNAK